MGFNSGFKGLSDCQFYLYVYKYVA